MDFASKLTFSKKKNIENNNSIKYLIEIDCVAYT